MKTPFLDLSGKIDQIIISALESILDKANSLSIPFFVIGATARDIILQYGHGIDTIRATMDLDLAVRVSNWRQFEKLTGILVEMGEFIKGKAAQRLEYDGKLPIDILPFGPIAEPDDSITWPRDKGVEMSVFGFKECYENSIIVRLRSNPNLDIRFVDITGLAILKLISWSENYPDRKKDAQDLALILRTYTDAGNEARLYSDETDIIEEEDFDYVIAGARLLGRDIAALGSIEVKSKILGILDFETGEQKRYRFIEDAMAGDWANERKFEEIRLLIEALKKGIVENSESGND